MKPFGLAKKQLRSFSNPLLEYLPASFDGQLVSDSEFEDVESLAQLSVETVVNERIKELGVRLTPEQMSERLLFNDGERAVISGLRFLNLDLKFPFVALKANFRVTDAETVRVLRNLVMRVYGESDPTGFTLWEQPGLDLGQSESWSVVVAGETDVPPLPLSNGFELRWVTSVDEFFNELKAEYANWSTENKDLSRFVDLHGQTELTSSAAKGYALALYDQTGWAGLIAGDRSPLFGTDALRITELFLVKRVRAKGLGKYLESAFLARLKSEFSVVWGHIHRSNEASLRTALTLGRMPLQQEYFFSLLSD